MDFNTISRTIRAMILMQVNHSHFGAVLDTLVLTRYAITQEIISEAEFHKMIYIVHTSKVPNKYSHKIIQEIVFTESFGKSSKPIMEWSYMRTNQHYVFLGALCEELAYGESLTDEQVKDFSIEMRGTANATIYFRGIKVGIVPIDWSNMSSTREFNAQEVVLQIHAKARLKLRQAEIPTWKELDSVI